MHKILASISKKQWIALTGLLMAGFLVGHLAGNLLLYTDSAKTFNAYAVWLTSKRPALFILEFGLLALLVVHVWLIVVVIRENLAARGTRYAVQKYSGPPSFAVRWMAMSGAVVLVFIVLHLLNFTLADHHGDGSVVANVNLGLYGLVYNTFQNPLYVAGYVLAMVLLGLHLDHAVQSSIKTFGFNHPFYTPKIRIAGRAFAVLIAVGFASIPIYMMTAVDPEKVAAKYLEATGEAAPVPAASAAAPGEEAR